VAWATTVLRKLQAPISASGVEVLDLWAQSEGMPDWTNNWLACGTPWPGSRPYNSAGVQIYATYNSGTSAIAWSLDHPPYTAIADGFRAVLGLVAMWKIINTSPWCRGCQTGHYPVALWTAAGRPSTATLAVMDLSAPQSTPTPGTSGGSTGIPYLAWGKVQEDAGPVAARLRERMITLATRIRKA
jgi:hypothetical protein